MNMAEAVNCLVKIYDGYLEENEEVELRLNLLNVQDLPLGYERFGRAMFPEHVCKAPALHYRKSISLLDWKTGLIDHALDMCKFFLQRFNCEQPNLHEARKLIEDMLSRNPRKH